MSVGGVIVAAATPIIAVGFGREWWAAEAIRADTDWPGVVDAALEIMVAAGVIRPEQSTFELACEQADRKRQPHPSRQEVAMGAAATTVEALVFSLRRGVNELTQPDTKRRLAALDAHQLKEACRRVQAFHPKIAKQWLADDVERLISAWKIPMDKKASLSDAEIDARIGNGRATADKLKSAQRTADDWLATFAKKSQEALAKRAAENQGAPQPNEVALVEALARKDHTEYDRLRGDVAETLGVRVGTLDDKVEMWRKKIEAEDDKGALPHWKVEPWPEPVDGAALLDSITRIFRRYIVLPKDADIGLALWVLHAWTMDAGDISPFMVLVSPTKRCGKTSVLILLYFLTPKSELASNITPSALFRYIEAVRPTLLIDEGDTFIKDNEELRGILDSGHTRVAANIVRNVEVNGEHRPRRFSTWAPKAIATIRKLADTLEDRSVIITLQRKARDAKVDRLRRRDSEEFATLRRQAARWAADNFKSLVDPNPAVPEVLNDRAADNWRPLLAIADLAGGPWPEAARRTARTLSGEEQDGAVNVELLRDIKTAFGDAEAIRSVHLIEKLTADPERPWADWKHGRPLTQKQLGSLLRPFCVTSETINFGGGQYAKGYRQAHFEDAWASYCPGQNTPPAQSGASEASFRHNADEMGTSSNFRSVTSCSGNGSKKGNLSYSHAGCDGMTDRKAKNSGQGHSDQEITFVDDALDIPPFLRRCFHCNGTVNEVALPDRTVWLHRECEKPWLATHHKCDSR